MKIVADDKIPFLKGVLEPFAIVDYLPGDSISNASLSAADALLTRSITLCNEELLKDTPVKFIATATIGDDHLDQEYLSRKSIQWATAKGCNADAVNQYVTAAFLAMADKYGLTLSGMTLGIIGVGEIGSRVKRSAEMLGLNTLCYDPPRERIEGSRGFASLEAIRSSADLLSLHVPLTYGGPDKTFHLVDGGFLKGFEKALILINTSRGAVTDTKALKEAVKEGRVKAVVLDVWENEPEVDEILVEDADIATPHIAGYSLEGKAMGSAMAVRALSRFFGLGLESWFPAIPEMNERVTLDCTGRSLQDILHNIFQAICPVMQESIRLKRNVVDFEELRRNYVFRKENKNYILELRNCNDLLARQLQGFGFRINQVERTN